MPFQVNTPAQAKAETLLERFSKCLQRSEAYAAKGLKSGQAAEEVELGAIVKAMRELHAANAECESPDFEDTLRLGLLREKLSLVKAKREKLAGKAVKGSFGLQAGPHGQIMADLDSEIVGLVRIIRQAETDLQAAAAPVIG